MLANNYSILLADDDEDDRILFEEALKEVSHNVQLTTVADGQQLIGLLKSVDRAPDVIFLDLNMPMKNGLECLIELKRDEKFKNFPVIIVSTTSELQTINKAYEYGANYYIRKPGAFLQLKKLLAKVIHMNWHQQTSQPSREKFVLTPE